MTSLAGQTTGRIPKELMPLINRLTNWQRNQWAKAKYPIDEAAVRKYLKMHRGRPVLKRRRRAEHA